MSDLRFELLGTGFWSRFQLATCLGFTGAKCVALNNRTRILGVARFLFGEATELYCQTRTMRNDIAGQDVATVMIRMYDGVTVTCNSCALATRAPKKESW